MKHDQTNIIPKLSKNESRIMNHCPDIEIGTIKEDYLYSIANKLDEYKSLIDNLTHELQQKKEK